MIFHEILETIENDDLRQFAIDRIENAPPYWHIVPASSSGRYHPQISLGRGGLVRHTIAVVRFLNYMLEVESIQNQFTSRERDLMRIAALCHDMMKSGTQIDYENNHHTKFNHPVLEANDIRLLYTLPTEEIELIAHCIESHMGQWNTTKRSNIVLPKPQDKYQIIVHLADYLASRKDIEIKFENSEIDSAKKSIEDYNDINPTTWIMDFGKYKGQSLGEIEALHPDYIRWLQKQEEFNRQPCKSLLIKMGYKFE